MKRDMKVALLLAITCFIGGMFVVPYQLDMQEAVLPGQFDEVMNIPYPLLIVLSGLQFGVITFILAFIGLKIARRTGFELPILDAVSKREKIHVDRSGITLAVVFGLITAFAIAGADRFYYQSKIEILGQIEQQFSLVGLLAGVLYGGVFEEVVMRLFFMSLFIWIVMKLFKKNAGTLNSGVYWFAIIIAAALFAAGHLPATQMLFGELTTTILIRCFLLNGIGGIFFGILYWKKGLEYAILAHMFTHVFLQILFYPLFY